MTRCKTLKSLSEDRLERKAEIARLATSGVPFDGSLRLWEGRILGVSSEAVFEIDPQTHEIKVLGTPPFPASTGAAAGDRGIYFGAGKDVWLYEWEQP